jgi:hypothetical protein
MAHRNFKRLAMTSLAGCLTALAPAMAKSQALPTASPQKQFAVFGGDSVHHWVGRGPDDCLSQGITQPPYPGYNERNNQIVAAEFISGRNAFGAGVFNDSCATPTSSEHVAIAYYKRRILAKNFGSHVETELALAIGGAYGYKDGNQTGVLLGPRLLSPMAGMILDFRVPLGTHWSVGARGLATTAFVTRPLISVGYNF